MVAVATTPAAADTTLTPIDWQPAGSLEFTSAYQYFDRKIGIDSAMGETTLRPTEGALTLAARVWFADWLSIELRQPSAVHRSLEVDGQAVDGTQTGIKNLELEGTSIARLGSWTLASSLDFEFPSGSPGVSSDRLTARTQLALGRELPWSARAYLAPSYLVRRGDSLNDAANAVALEAGYLQRWSRLALLPSVAIERTSALDGGAAEAPFVSLRAQLVAALALTDKLEVSAMAWREAATEHAVGGGERGQASETRVGLGVHYTWDMPRTASGAKDVPAPASMRLLPLSVDGRPPDRRMQGEAGDLMPQLRLATMAAERAAGGASGTMLVKVERMRRDQPRRVRVEDTIGAPTLAHVVERFFRDATLPETLARAQQLELMICFEVCTN